MGCHGLKKEDGGFPAGWERPWWACKGVKAPPGQRASQPGPTMPLDAIKDQTASLARRRDGSGGRPRNCKGFRVQIYLLAISNYRVQGSSIMGAQSDCYTMDYGTLLQGRLWYTFARKTK
nr:hypothetical protein Iba_chr10bCG12660 [Ipomoea batatas]